MRNCHQALAVHEDLSLVHSQVVTLHPSDTAPRPFSLQRGLQTQIPQRRLSSAPPRRRCA